MAAFSTTSLKRLETCHPDLQRLFEDVVQKVDCTVLVGHRGQEEQEQAFREGNSQKRWPDGEHNKLPSVAVDVAPYVPGVENIWEIDNPAVQVAWWRLVYCVLRAAERLRIKVRWGNDWNTDGDTKDTRLKDWPHWELA